MQIRSIVCGITRWLPLLIMRHVRSTDNILTQSSCVCVCVCVCVRACVYVYESVQWCIYRRERESKKSAWRHETAFLYNPFITSAVSETFFFYSKLFLSSALLSHTFFYPCYILSLEWLLLVDHQLYL
jgi:hypothetical protein